MGLRRERTSGMDRMASWPVGEVWLVHDGFGGRVFQLVATEKAARFVERYERQHNPNVVVERRQVDDAGRELPEYHIARTKWEATVPTVEQFKEQIEAEAAKAVEKGYTPEHDREHGADHLLNWAVEYARLGKPAASANLIQAARRVLIQSATARGRCEYVDPDEGRCLLLDEHADNHWPSMAAVADPIGSKADRG